MLTELNLNVSYKFCQKQIFIWTAIPFSHIPGKSFHQDRSVNPNPASLKSNFIILFNENVLIWRWMEEDLFASLLQCKPFLPAASLCLPIRKIRGKSGASAC